jgi:hypothetical protein
MHKLCQNQNMLIFKQLQRLQTILAYDIAQQVCGFDTLLLLENGKMGLFSACCRSGIVVALLFTIDI